MDDSAKEITSGRIPSLDGLRTVSIALVIVAHSLHTLGIKDHNVGALGVRVFFVISGFLITGLLIAELRKTSTISLRKFYFRRTLRIFPPYYFYLLVLLIVSAVSGAAVAGRDFFPAIAYVSNYVDPHRWDLGHTWSLSVEEQFYLLYPGLLVLLGRRKTIGALLLVILVSPLVRIIDFKFFGDARWVGMGFHSNADALAIGCLLAYFYLKLNSTATYRRLLDSRWMLLAPLLIVLLNSQNDHPLLFAVCASMTNVLIALCLNWAVVKSRESLIGRTLNTAPLVTLGVMSYSIYLWQQAFFNPDSQQFFTRFPYNILGIAIFSCFSYLVVEKYSLRLRKRLGDRLFSRKDEAEPRSLGEAAPATKSMATAA